MSRLDIPGRSAYLWIYDEWLASQPRYGACVVEVGVALGKSLSYLAEACMTDHRRDIAIYGVDTWAGTARNGEQQLLADDMGGDFTLYARQMLAHAPQAFEMIRPLRVDSVRAAGFFRPYQDVDLLILDGAHDYDTVRLEIAAWAECLAPGGWIGGDDYMPEFQGVIDAVTGAFGGRVEVRHDEGWGTWLVRP